MDPYTAYHRVRERLEALGYAPQHLQDDDFFPALIKAEEKIAELIGPLDLKEPLTVCNYLVLLPFVLTTRLIQAVGAKAFLFGYEVECPMIRKRFYVESVTGQIYLFPLAA